MFVHKIKLAPAAAETQMCCFRDMKGGVNTNIKI